MIYWPYLFSNYCNWLDYTSLISQLFIYITYRLNYEVFKSETALCRETETVRNSLTKVKASWQKQRGRKNFCLCFFFLSILCFLPNISLFPSWFVFFNYTYRTGDFQYPHAWYKTCIKLEAKLWWYSLNIVIKVAFSIFL